MTLRFLCLLLLAVPGLSQVIPGRYVLELEGQPLRQEARAAVLSEGGRTKLAAIRKLQQSVEVGVSLVRGRVISRMQNLMNALVVEVPQEAAGQLAGLQGVVKVFPVTVASVSAEPVLPAAPCGYQIQLNNLQAAGAEAAIFYGLLPFNSVGSADWSPGNATLPGMTVTNTYTPALKSLAASATAVKVTFEGLSLPQDPNILATFSSQGPTESFRVKPDLIAAGTNVYAATQSTYPAGAGYSSNGYLAVNGTSFAAPLVAGAAAVLKAARPGLTVEQYRSLLINSADPLVSARGVVERVQHSGNGSLDLNSAMASSIAVYPASIGFSFDYSTTVFHDHKFTVTNVGSMTEVFTVSSIPFDSQAVPLFSTNGTGTILAGTPVKTLQLTLTPKQSVIVTMIWNDRPYVGSDYEGMVAIRGRITGSLALVPYWDWDATAHFWYNPAYLFYFPQSLTVPAGIDFAVNFRVTDPIGISFGIYGPTATFVRGSGTARSCVPSDYTSDVYLGFGCFKFSNVAVGDNLIQIKVQGFGPFNVPVSVTNGASSALPAADPAIYRLGATGWEILRGKR